MRTSNLRWTSSLLLVASLGLGCAKEDDPSGSASSDGSTGGDSTGGMSMTSGMSMTTVMSDSMSTSMSSETEPGTISVGESSTGAPVPQPNGSMCDDNAMCESMMCFVVGPLGGICGECLTDADCEGGGCSIPNPLATPPEGATCNMGEPGEGCMSDAVCQEGLVCATILDVPGIFTASTCSECLDDAACGDDLCSPTYDIADLSGQNTCVPPGSVADGDGCALDGTGDMACMSGFCAGADVLGVLMLGVCSGCEADTDCAMGEVCEAPMVDLMMGLIAGGCVPA